MKIKFKDGTIVEVISTNNEVVNMKELRNRMARAALAVKDASVPPHKQFNYLVDRETQKILGPYEMVRDYDGNVKLYHTEFEYKYKLDPNGEPIRDQDGNLIPIALKIIPKDEYEKRYILVHSIDGGKWVIENEISPEGIEKRQKELEIRLKEEKKLAEEAKQRKEQKEDEQRKIAATEKKSNNMRKWNIAKRYKKMNQSYEENEENEEKNEIQKSMVGLAEYLDEPKTREYWSVTLPTKVEEAARTRVVGESEKDILMDVYVEPLMTQINARFSSTQEMSPRNIEKFKYNLIDIVNENMKWSAFNPQGIGDALKRIFGYIENYIYKAYLQSGKRQHMGLSNDYQFDKHTDKDVKKRFKQLYGSEWDPYTRRGGLSHKEEWNKVRERERRRKESGSKPMYTGFKEDISGNVPDKKGDE